MGYRDIGSVQTGRADIGVTEALQLGTPGQRGNIDYDQIRISVRQGTGGKFQMVTGSTPANGIPMWDANGNLVSAGLQTSALQTPWLSNIDGAGYQLSNTGPVGIGTPVTAGGATLDVLGPHNPSTGILRVKGTGAYGFIVLDTTTTASALSGFVLETGGNKVGEISYNADMSAVRLINWVASPSWLSIFTNGRIGVNTDTPATALDVNGGLTVRQNAVINGTLGVLAMPTTNPGAGTKQLWADPADSYRVKFAN